ncbi:hypothetical protein SDC9_126574 [bioreactor metagenome]|uniref:Uncharacterized protein n=1 Tax=bioreactor metagenome TaxID=1076179 RepID=A0A645CR28_9ZZZZ
MLAIKKEGICLPAAAFASRAPAARFAARAYESRNAVSLGFFKLAARASFTMSSTPCVKYASKSKPVFKRQPPLFHQCMNRLTHLAILSDFLSKNNQLAGCFFTAEPFFPRFPQPLRKLIPTSAIRIGFFSTTGCFC